jgi:hypothetical protein
MVVEVAIIGLLLYRRVWQNLPFFCAYVVWGLLSDAINYLFQRHLAGVSAQGYLISYVVTSVIESALQIGVLIELAWAILRPLRPSLSNRALLLVALLVLAIGAAIWPFAGLHGLSRYSPAWQNLVHVQQTTSILRVLFFLGLAAGSQLLSIGWRDRELQVATGLGFYSLVNLAMSIWLSHQGMGSHAFTLETKVLTVAYFCSLLYWVFSFAQKEAERREFTPQMQSFLLAMAGSARSTRIGLSNSEHRPPRDRRK